MTCSVYERTIIQKHLRIQLQDTYTGREIEKLEIGSYESLTSLLRSTVEGREGNSVLLLGPRGSGKSHCIRNALASLSSSFSLVHLNGFIHANDRHGLHEIARQLHCNNVLSATAGDFNDDDIEECAYEDASHEPQHHNLIAGSVADTVQLILASLHRNDDDIAMPVVIVLDEFDLFALQSKQTLLYNLLDISQSNNVVPLIVIGVTVRVDAVELLEKRVRSRFSHRTLHFHPPEFHSYLNKFVHMLSIVAADVGVSDVLVAAWNHHVDYLSNHVNILSTLRSLFAVDSSLRTLKLHLMRAVCRMQRLDECSCGSSNAITEDKNRKRKRSTSTALDVSSWLPPDWIEVASVAQRVNSKSFLLESLSIFEISLLIAIKHYTKRFDEDLFCFEIIYKEFATFKQSSRSLSTMTNSKRTATKAFGHLIDLELVRYTQSTGMQSKTSREYRLCQLMVSVEQVSSAVKRYPNCPEDIRGWNNNIIY